MGLAIEIFGLDVLSSNVNWLNKTIKLPSPRIKHVCLTLRHFKTMSYYILNMNFNITNLDYQKIIKPYFNNHRLPIDFEELTEGIDYVIAPIYVTEKCLTIGIFFINKKVIEEIQKEVENTFFKEEQSKNKNITKYTLFSTIEPLPKYTLPLFKNKYNILSGVLGYRNNNGFGDKHYDQLVGKVFNFNLGFDIGFSNIELKQVLGNVRNYFPKLDIVVSTSGYNYNVFSKSSKSITLPKSDPTTLSA